MLSALKSLSAGAMPIEFECLQNRYQSERHYAKGTVNRMVIVEAKLKN